MSTEVEVTEQQLETVKKVIAPNATPEELELFLFDCKRRGVHPLAKLIHFTKRGGKYVPVTSIDYMRSQASATGEYAGSDDALFSGARKTNDSTATVTVYRMVKEQRCAFTASALWDEYCPPEGRDMMWQKMPRTMLAKCAESLALRKGFPQQLAGLYSAEEMQQANGNSTPKAEQPVTNTHLIEEEGEPELPADPFPKKPTTTTDNPASKAGKGKVGAVGLEKGFSKDSLSKKIIEWTGGRGYNDLTHSDVDHCLRELKKLEKPVPPRDKKLQELDKLKVEKAERIKEPVEEEMPF